MTYPNCDEELHKQVETLKLDANIIPNYLPSSRRVNSKVFGLATSYPTSSPEASKVGSDLMEVFEDKGLNHKGNML